MIADVLILAEECQWLAELALERNQHDVAGAFYFAAAMAFRLADQHAESPHVA